MLIAQRQFFGLLILSDQQSKMKSGKSSRLSSCNQQIFDSFLLAGKMTEEAELLEI